MLKEQLISHQELLDAITRGATVLTGNNRLAGDLIDKFDHFNINNKQVAWSSPDIFPINNWLIKNWEQAILSGIISSENSLLSIEQEFQIWEAIIKQSPSGNALLRISATAKSVSDAWRLLQNWNLSREHYDYHDSDDARAFHYWSREFEKRCSTEHWIVTAQLASFDFYAKLITNREIILLGFDELTPRMQSLFEGLKNSRCDIKWLRQDSRGHSVTRLQCDDIRDEIETFVTWAKLKLEENSSNRIALVTPDIKSIRSILVHNLERILMPSSCFSFSEVQENSHNNIMTSRPWDISLGMALADYSLIKLAFQLLGFVRGKQTIETVSSLLRSPHIIGASEERNQRALLDCQLRELGESFVSLKTVLFYSKQADSKYFCPVLFGIITQLIKLRQSCLNKADNHQWAVWINNWLICAGWGSGRTISSDEYQIIEAWKTLLQSFTSLRAVSTKITFEEAVSCLHRLASDKIFQVQSKSAPIQILGMYESIGLTFDYLWVMNLHDEVWPVSPRPNPFIPLAIQKKYGMPHASWERELSVAWKITNRLENSARDVIFSYPVKNGIQDLHFSPLISEYETSSKQVLLIKPTLRWQQIIQQQSKLVKLDNDVVNVVASEKISGGSSIFKNQSLCPFRAFAENRLHAKPMSKTQLGLDAKKRGSLLHVVLEKFWTKITSQQQLKSTTTGQLEIIIKNCIDNAISDMTKKSPDTFSDRFTRIEKQRLLQLLNIWLELELQRAPFKVIVTERELNIDVNGVKAHLFIDRVDELENGNEIVIDYKTGLVSPSDWFGDRPSDPQLPLYSITSSKNLSAVLFAQLKTGDVKFNGVVEQADTIPDLPSRYNKNLKEVTKNWPKVLTDWDTVIKSLANDFIQAHIEVDPKDGQATCRKLYCELSPLCRINELIANNGLSSSTNQTGDES